MDEISGTADYTMYAEEDTKNPKFQRSVKLREIRG